MTRRAITVDVAVFGAGTAGAGVALQFARRGRSVVLVERRGPDDGGAQWHNGVLDWQFERAGIDPPSGHERYAAHGVTHMVGPDHTRAVTVTSPTVTADMALLGRRLRAAARDLGVELISNAQHLEPEFSGGRIIAVEAMPGTRSSGPTGDVVRIQASLFVDATGRRGLLRQHSPALQRWCSPVRGGELCSAADFHLRTANRDGVQRFLDRYDIEPGHTVTMLGPSGGFSTRAITVSEDLTEVKVLVGCLADGRHGTGPRMLDDLRRAETWIGPSISGGFGVIPLRRPYARFTAPGLALVGDSACQVFPAHGSGIGLGLIAGRLLADAVAELEDPGHENSLWNYQAAFQHEFGGLLLSSDAFRRLSTAIGSTGVADLVRSGLMTETAVVAGLDQRWPRPPTGELISMASHLVRAPRLAAQMLPGLTRAQILGNLGSRYPRQPDIGRLERWDRTAGRLLGPLPT